MSINLSATTPAAPAGKINIIFQADGLGNISGYTSAPTLPAHLSYSDPTLTVSAATFGNGRIALSGNTSGTATVTAPAIAGIRTNSIVFSNIVEGPLETGPIFQWDDGSGHKLGIGDDGSIWGPGSIVFWYNGQRQIVIGDSNTSSLVLKSNYTIQWSAGSIDANAARDAGISRLGAASFGFGNSLPGDITANLSFNRVSQAGADFAGQATITTGNTTKAVTFAANYTGTGQPVIVLTPTSDPLALGVPVGYWVTYSGSAGAWTGFTVNIQTALAGNVTFNYIVIGVA